MEKYWESWGTEQGKVGMENCHKSEVTLNSHIFLGLSKERTECRHVKKFQYYLVLGYFGRYHKGIQY